MPSLNPLASPRASRVTPARGPAWGRSALGIAILCHAILGLALMSCGRAPEPLPGPPEGGWRAEALETWDHGRLVAAASVEGREALVVALWAQWCEPCIAELPELSALAAAHPRWGVLSLSTDDLGSPSTRARVQAVLDRVRPTHALGKIPPGGEFRLLEALGLEWDGILPKTLLIIAAERGAPQRGGSLLEGRSRDELAREIEERLRRGGPGPGATP